MPNFIVPSAIKAEIYAFIVYSCSNYIEIEHQRRAKLQLSELRLTKHSLELVSKFFD